MKHEMKLAELREQWEVGARVVTSRVDQDGNRVLVVLRDPFGSGTYLAHRYFVLGSGATEGWVISVDGENLNAEQVMRWLNDPSARTANEEVTE